MMSDRGGFTLIELTVVVLIVSILAAIAQPKLSEVLVKARTADAYADVQVVRIAALAFQANENDWPTDVNRGVVPPGMDKYLPADFNLPTRCGEACRSRDLRCLHAEHERRRIR